MSEGLEKYCPVPKTHSKLTQAHELWHQALDHYGDPDSFTTYLNTTIQALRNVTFTLQKEKSGIPDFDPWYEGWRETMKQDPVMRWLVEARNFIVKQAISKHTAPP